MTRATTRTIAILSILCGVVLILESYDYLEGIWRLWPIFPLILGIGFILLFFNRGRADAALLGIGTYLVCCGAFFFFLNVTTWALLAHLWPLFIGFMGLSFLAPVIWQGKRGIIVPIALFMLFLSGVLLLVVTVDNRLWPISLILFGACLLLLGRCDRKESIS